MPHLIIRKGPKRGHRFPLEEPCVFLGRDDVNCDIYLESSDPNRKLAISRKHANITCEAGKYYIQDGNGEGRPSHNKTFVNKEEVVFPSRLLLHNGDAITICDYLLTFHDELPVAEADPDSSGVIKASLSHDDSSLTLARSAEKLQLLLDISNRLSHELEMDKLLPEVVDSLLQSFKQADRGFLIMADEKSGSLTPRVFKTRRVEDAAQHRFSVSIVRQCVAQVRGLLTTDPRREFAQSESISELEIRSALCAPLWTRDGEAFGVLLLDSHHEKPFTEDDLSFLMGVAGQASIAIRNAKYHANALAWERRAADLATAREVVKSFLPERLPEIPGYEFFASYESAMEVGGDYYDFIALPKGQQAVLVGDVAGKGVTAALMMARFSAGTRACLENEPDLAVATRRLNVLAQPMGLTERYITLAIVQLDPKTHIVTTVSAGHPPILLMRRATRMPEVVDLDVGRGSFLGIFPDSEYQSHRLTLQPGDSLILYSDGVSEAMNKDNNQLGMEGIRAAIRGTSAGPRQLGDLILHAVEAHTAGCSQHDDITLVCFGRVG